MATILVAVAAAAAAATAAVVVVVVVVLFPAREIGIIDLKKMGQLIVDGDV